MKPLAETSIAVVGFGLMGGSMALALRNKVAEIVAVDVDPRTLDLAHSIEAADNVHSDLREGTAHSDLVIIATPVRTILEIIPSLPEMRKTPFAILDLGSTKKEINSKMSELPSSISAFGGHPMCGKEIGGLSAASPDLYIDKTFILCRNERSTPELEGYLLTLIEAIGAQPLFLSAETHDKLVALSSHLPFLLSALLVDQVNERAQEDIRTWQVTASGFNGMARLAGSNPKMIRDILATNPKNILRELRQFASELNSVINMMEDENHQLLSDWLDSIQKTYFSYRKYKEE